MGQVQFGLGQQYPPYPNDHWPADTDRWLLTASVNKSVGGTVYYILIYDAHANSLLGSCGTGDSCNVEAPSSSLDFIAYVAGYSYTAPPTDIQTMATPTGVRTDLRNVPMSLGEFETYWPSGDTADRDTWMRTGDAYRDALFGYTMLAFNEAHATAVAMRATSGRERYGNATIRADFGNWGAQLNSRGLDSPFSVAGGGPGGGYGFPDLSATEGSDVQLWEVKFNSPAGLVVGSLQLSRYLYAAGTAPKLCGLYGRPWRGVHRLPVGHESHRGIRCDGS